MLSPWVGLAASGFGGGLLSGLLLGRSVSGLDLWWSAEDRALLLSDLLDLLQLPKVDHVEHDHSGRILLGH